jgi:hypothetical protein
MWEPASTEFNHELSERQCRKAVSVDRNPVVDEVILEASEDARDFDVVINPTFYVNEIV